jgi:hypothetical protein
MRTLISSSNSLKSKTACFSLTYGFRLKNEKIPIISYRLIHSRLLFVCCIKKITCKWETADSSFYLLRYMLFFLYKSRKLGSYKSLINRMASPVDFISGPSSRLTFGNLSKEKTGSFIAYPTNRL